MRHQFPFALPGQRIGLLGGSFDPPHAGHVQISQRALRALELDRVWWLISPRNPLKAHGPAPLGRRLELARTLITHPRIVPTDIEILLGTQRTADTLAGLFGLYPGTRFVWLMGADNLAQLHRWDRWRWIMDNVPVAVIDRPGARMAALSAPAARAYARYRLASSAGCLLASRRAPAWVTLGGPLSPLSSTRIRGQATGTAQDDRSTT